MIMPTTLIKRYANELKEKNSGSYSHSSGYTVGKTRYIPLSRLTLEEY